MLSLSVGLFWLASKTSPISFPLQCASGLFTSFSFCMFYFPASSAASWPLESPSLHHPSLDSSPTYSLCPPVPTVFRMPSYWPFGVLSDQPCAFGRQGKTKAAGLPTVIRMQHKQMPHILHSSIPHHSGDPRKQSTQQGINWLVGHRVTWEVRVIQQG